jgi:DegV family protein with EDD domain
MSKFGLVFDSTVYLEKEMLAKNEVRIASLNVVEGTESYREVEVDVPFVLAKQDKGAGLMTSQPSPGEFLEAFEELIKEGKEKIFVITLSKNISGTFQSATLAKNMLENPDIVYVFDTMLCAYGTEMIALELIEMINKGSNEKSIITRIDNIIKNSTQMFTVENLFSLARGGRLSSTQAMIGTVLRVKPIIKVIDGKLVLDKKERSYKKVHKYMIDTIKETLKGKDTVTFYVTETHSPVSGEMLRDELLEIFPNAKLTFTRYLGPVFSIHVGKKGYGLSWFVE